MAGRRLIRTSALDDENFLRSEWLLTNGLGGYASASISGAMTRKYHGMLVAALPSPFGRTVMLNHLSEKIIFPDGATYKLGCEEGNNHSEGMENLKEFRLEGGMPVWLFEINGIAIEKRAVMVHLQNTVHISYRTLSSQGPVSLQIQPSIHFRAHEAPVNMPIDELYRTAVIHNHYEISQGLFPPLRLKIEGGHSQFILEDRILQNIFYYHESKTGYESLGELWSPGYFKVDLQSDSRATLIASTESWETISALTATEALQSEQDRRSRLLFAAPSNAKEGMGGELVLAADRFVIIPASRVKEAARAHAAGNEIRTIIAGYHWFTDWGRDTMISLEGLTLCTGRFQEARWILLTFAHAVRSGLIPNLFPEGQNEGLYHTSDATLWFFHAIDRYVNISQDKQLLHFLLPVLSDIIYHHLQGTAFGIGVDPHDGLLKQGMEGLQLTWMDAKVADWVVTPRRGKAVEINSLWYNALRLLEEWLREVRGEESARPFKEQADRVYQTFNEQFWFKKGGYLYDVIDGQLKDLSCRPNQLFAFSLKHPVLKPSRWESVIKIVEKELLTPFGLRTLSSQHDAYKSRYDGDLRARDAAYHQGTIWAWLIGPFIDAWIRVYPQEREGSRRFLKEFQNHLNEAGIGSISEIFDATEPFTPRGCIAQAWSVAEVLRCWIKTAPDEK
ncbi:MAG: glycogen debranching enzyme family protein [Candidatus Protochlamydia sp.]|nr:glycogen debranching enzyme family protein [Candidatus Protochlamydia sp.]